MLLYGNTSWTSPYVLSCFVALREKGIAFDVKVVALDRGEQYDADFARSSLTARVTLSESSAIVEYLEDAYPAPGHARVMPAGVRERARARQVMAWVRSDVGALREERSSEWVFYPHAEIEPYKPLSSDARHAAKKVIALAEQLVPRDAGPMFGAWCVADTDLAMMLQRLIKCGDDVPARVRDYAERQWDRPAVKEYRAQKRPPFHGARTYPTAQLT
jgi:glutathione S-transferase